MTHPACCAGHSCDQCAICLSGICCLTVASSAPAVATTVTVDQADRLHEAITEEAESGVSLVQLIRFDVTGRRGVQPTPAALLPAPEPVDIFKTDQEEAQHVDAARPFR